MSNQEKVEHGRVAPHRTYTLTHHEHDGRFYTTMARRVTYPGIFTPEELLETCRQQAKLLDMLVLDVHLRCSATHVLETRIPALHDVQLAGTERGLTLQANITWVSPEPPSPAWLNGIKEIMAAAHFDQT